MFTTRKEIRVMNALKDQRYPKITRMIPLTRKELEVGRLVASRMEKRMNIDSKGPNNDLVGLSRDLAQKISESKKQEEES